MPRPTQVTGKELWLDDVTGTSVALASDGVLVAEGNGAPRLFPFADIETVGLSRLAPAPLWMPEVRRRKWLPAPAGALVPVFSCTITLRAGPVLNIMSITADDAGRILDRSGAYRGFVERLHRALVGTKGTTSFLAGDAEHMPRFWLASAFAAAIASLLLLIPWSGFPSTIALFIAGMLAAFAAAVLWRARTLRSGANFQPYDPANLPARYLPSPEQLATGPLSR